MPNFIINQDKFINVYKQLQLYIISEKTNYVHTIAIFA